ncbi:MAG: hypothetical protein R2865_00315 [Deinococcales bacterium]
MPLLAFYLVMGPKVGQQWLKGLKERSFESILLARLIFLPGDLVNYAAGFWRINLIAFLAATAIGGTPGMLVGLFAGAALRQEGISFGSAELKLRYDYLFVAVGIMLSSLILSWYLKRQQALKSSI